MDDNEITALAKGMVPFVRECVDDAICKMTIVPPELAAQIASAVRLLHESPPIPAKSENAPPKSAPRVSRIERDDNGALVPIYDEPQQ
jgi:hypothetical protein